MLDCSNSHHPCLGEMSSPPEITPSTAPAAPVTTWPRRVLRSLFTIPLALWVFLEEWVWDAMLATMAWLGRLPPVRWTEAQIGKLPPYAALIVFSVPGAILFPFKLAALWLIAQGHAVYGMGVFLIAKIIGTALLARIFSLTKPALLTIGWFSTVYFAITAWRDRLYAYVRALPAYQRLCDWTRNTKARMKTWWRQHLSRERRGG